MLRGLWSLDYLNGKNRFRWTWAVFLSQLWKATEGRREVEPDTSRLCFPQCAHTGLEWLEHGEAGWREASSLKSIYLSYLEGEARGILLCPEHALVVNSVSLPGVNCVQPECSEEARRCVKGKEAALHTASLPLLPGLVHSLNQVWFWFCGWGSLQPQTAHVWLCTGWSSQGFLLGRWDNWCPEVMVRSPDMWKILNKSLVSVIIWLCNPHKILLPKWFKQQKLTFRPLPTRSLCKACSCLSVSPLICALCRELQPWCFSLSYKDSGPTGLVPTFTASFNSNNHLEHPMEARILTQELGWAQFSG